jgi:molybdenum cofactor biosynthesis enzyme
MEFTEEQLLIVENLAGINYTIRQIAMYFDVSSTSLHNEYQDKKSEFAYHFDRGKLMASADVDMKLLTSAKDGNLTAAAMFKKAEKESRINNLKNELFGL